MTQVEAIEARIVEAIARAEDLHPLALMLLLRDYRLHGRDDLREALEAGLSRGLEACQDPAAADAWAAWLTLFVDAIALSDDERLRAAARNLIDRLHKTWSMESIEACLRAIALPEARHLAPDAIDALERLVAASYVPGRGMAPLAGGAMSGARGPVARAAGTLADQVRAASALLTAYEVCGRLPYAMLAEELVQVARLQPLGDDLALNCEVARVLGRLAALHADADYRAAAVIAPGADYRRDAERILAAESERALESGVGGAIYALALVELESLDPYVD